jgi:serine/threonine-protein kinase HipA
MIFNVVTGNRDDHTKNFAFLMGASGEWRNTPAYDLTYNTGIYGEHTMSVAGKGKGITLDDICTITKLANLSVKETQRIVESVCDSTRDFKAEALNLGATRGQVNEISGYIEKSISCLTPAVISVKESKKADRSKKDIERKAPSSRR